MSIFYGSAPALITPFFKEGGVDLETYGRLIDSTIQGGSNAVVVLGTTGEPATMTAAEKASVIEYAVRKVAGRVPVIVGTGGNCTAEVIERSAQAQAFGADALLIVTPYYNKCTQKGLIAHFNAVADRVNLPIILYNVPGRTGVNLLPATAVALSAHKNIVAIKEACGNIDQISELLRVCEGKLDVYSGDDGVVLPLLSLGACGVISVAANAIPAEMTAICTLFAAGKVKEAAALQHKINPFVKALFLEVNPIPVKAAMNLLGYGDGSLRLPLTTIELQNLAVLKQEMTSLNLL